jgi:hypothetical protein
VYTTKITLGNGAYGYLSLVLQETLRAKCDQGTQAKLSSSVHSVLTYFRWLAADFTRRPTHIAEIIPTYKPDILGAQDAAAMGMGGVRFVTQHNGLIQPMLWRCPFPEAIEQHLVTFYNPGGGINNSELDLAASIAQHDICAQSFDVKEATIHNSSDNVATVWWQWKGAASFGVLMARLLRLQALHQCHYRYVLIFHYIDGEATTVADACIRLWHLSDAQVLAPLYPQSRPWMLCHLRKPIHCALRPALSTTTSIPDLQNSVPTPWTNIGLAGMHSAWSTISINMQDVGLQPLSKSDLPPPHLIPLPRRKMVTETRNWFKD